MVRPNGHLLPVLARLATATGQILSQLQQIATRGLRKIGRVRRPGASRTSVDQDAQRTLQERIETQQHRTQHFGKCGKCQPFPSPLHIIAGSETDLRNTHFEASRP